MLEFIHFMSISQEEDANQMAHAPLVKTALDANTATKKVELAAYAGDKLRREKLNEIYYFFIVKQILYLHNSNNITKIA